MHSEDVKVQELRTRGEKAWQGVAGEPKSNVPARIVGVSPGHNGKQAYILQVRHDTDSVQRHPGDIQNIIIFVFEQVGKDREVW